ncbi:hypothetical protein PRIC1_007204 [Phytophthora ramorum]
MQAAFYIRYTCHFAGHGHAQVSRHGHARIARHQPISHTEPQSEVSLPRSAPESATRAVQSSPSRHKGDVGKLVYCFLREYPSRPAHRSAPGGFPLAREPQPEPATTSYDPSHHYNGLVRRHAQLPLRQRPRNRHAMPRQKDTKRIDPTRARAPGDAAADAGPHNVFKVSGSPIISPRSIRHCLEEPEYGLDGKPRKHSNGGVTLPHPPISEEDALVAAAAVQAKEAQKALEAEQAATASLQGLSGVQLVVHQMLATHTHTLTTLGVERAEFPNTRLSLKQVETMLSPVVALCNALRADHFGIHVPTPQIASTMSDVHYWKLWESDTIDIGIFFMPPNSSIPLHNHPGMSVVTRVLYGAATVTSSDAVNPEKGSVSWARVSRKGQFGQETTTWLDPRRFNLHNITASSDIGCAMLDIMVPPYDNANRDCHHFQILEQKMVRNERLVKMLESIKPDNHMDPPTSNGTANSSPMSS